MIAYGEAFLGTGNRKIKIPVVQLQGESRNDIVGCVRSQVLPYNGLDPGSVRIDIQFQLTKVHSAFGIAFCNQPCQTLEHLPPSVFKPQLESVGVNSLLIRHNTQFPSRKEATKYGVSKKRRT